MTKRVAIVQSSYIPWKGYFDLIAAVDEFILFDDVQFTKRDWRSRNRIKTAQGPQWLSIPCLTKGRMEQLICETEVANHAWTREHWHAIELSYRRTPFFHLYRDQLQALFFQAEELSLLSDINRLLIAGLAGLLGISTPLRDSRTYEPQGRKTDRLLSICVAAGATVYLSGPSARSYIETEKFSSRDIQVIYADYGDYPEYSQLYPPFTHEVSVIDLLCNVGQEAPRYMKKLL